MPGPSEPESTRRIRIAVDLLGRDCAPDAVLAGTALALRVRGVGGKPDGFTGNVLLKGMHRREPIPAVPSPAHPAAG